MFLEYKGPRSLTKRRIHIMADKIENIYELRPLIEQIPESWRDRIEEIGERYK